jgi:hypothetical protein
MTEIKTHSVVTRKEGRVCQGGGAEYEERHWRNLSAALPLLSKRHSKLTVDSVLI